MEDGGVGTDAAVLIQAQLKEQREALEEVLELQALDEADLSEVSDLRLRKAICSAAEFSCTKNLSVALLISDS